MNAEKAKESTKPEIVRDEHIDFLDNLRKYGVKNIFETASHLIKEYPELKDKEAIKVLKYWMKTF